MKPLDAVIGIDLGGTFTKIGVVDYRGNMLMLDRFPSRADEPFEYFLNELQQSFHNIKNTLGSQVHLLAIGVGAPDTNCFTGEMENPPNFKWGEVVPLASGIQGVTGLPVFVNNDANVAALGEMIYGGGKGMKHLVVVTLGTGVGSGFIVDGKLHIGHHGMAGELGHVNAVRGGRLCRCGLYGCLEQYSSVTGVRKSVRIIAQETNKPSQFRGLSLEEINGEKIASAALAGDEIAKEAFEIAGKLLGEKLADVVAFFNPEAIFLTGGLVKAGHLIFEPTEKHMEQNLLHIYHHRAKILISDLVDKEGAVLGAAALGWDKIK
jgi:glucokinase